MPDYCVAYGCSNERNIETRARGITFHRFPYDASRRRVWERTLKRADFVATKRSVLCSEHFNEEDFDRTGQTVRLRDGVKPSVFNFPFRSKMKQEVTRTSKTSRKAEVKVEETLPVVISQPTRGAEPLKDLQYLHDHSYALSPSPAALKARLNEALARVEILEREKRNSRIRERRAKKNLLTLLQDVREKNLLYEEQRESLEICSDTMELLI